MDSIIDDVVCDITAHVPTMTGRPSAQVSGIGATAPLSTSLPISILLISIGRFLDPGTIAFIAFPPNLLHSPSNLASDN